MKVFKYGKFCGPYFPVIGLNIGKYGPEKTPYLDNFHAGTDKNTSRHADTLTTLVRSLSNCHGTQSHNNLVHKRTLNHLAELAVNG